MQVLSIVIGMAVAIFMLPILMSLISDHGAGFYARFKSQFRDTRARAEQSMLLKNYMHRFNGFVRSGMPMALALLAAALALAYPTVIHAQTATTVPTINIPVDQIFGSVNTWINTLVPVYAIPAGIAIAVAVLGLVVALIVTAFGKSRGGR